MKKRILTLAGVLVLVAVLIAPMVVLGDNTATQDASTSSAAAIEIRAQDYSTVVADIIFPEGAPSAEVSDPSNDKPETQILGAAGTAKPVVTLVNTAAVPYNIWYNIETFDNGVVSSENYVIIAKGGACATAAAIDQSVTFDADTQAAGTITTIDESGAGGDERDFYLKITLSALAGKSGSSILTILGESA